MKYVSSTGGSGARYTQDSCQRKRLESLGWIRLGADGHSFERIRGDKQHPASQGYTCEKALRLDHYQNGRGERVLNPL
ncbi:MAG: hypothetical protein KC933_05000, partial [Myxococcales bacterium]|nr:hypothetical protein [Myxococcales bacterium]